MRFSKLDKEYNKEVSVAIRERILLVIRIVEDKQHIENVAKELHKCRAWAYKWYKRYKEDGGLDGLKDKERSGRPSIVPKERMMKIRQELIDNYTEWDYRQVMDLIYNKTGVRYHGVHIYRLLHKWGLKPKVPEKKFIKTVPVKEKKRFKKNKKLSSLKLE